MMNIQQIAKVDANLLPVLLKSFEDQQSFKVRNIANIFAIINRIKINNKKHYFLERIRNSYQEH